MKYYHDSLKPGIRYSLRQDREGAWRIYRQAKPGAAWRKANERSYMHQHIADEEMAAFAVLHGLLEDEYDDPADRQ